MKRVIPLITFLITGIALVYMIAAISLDIKGIARSDAFNWLSLSWIGVGTGLFSLLVLAFSLILAVIWVLLFIAWLVSRHDDSRDAVELL